MEGNGYIHHGAKDRAEVGEHGPGPAIPGVLGPQRIVLQPGPR